MKCEEREGEMNVRVLSKRFFSFFKIKTRIASDPADEDTRTLWKSVKIKSILLQNEGGEAGGASLPCHKLHMKQEEREEGGREINTKLIHFL